MAGSNIEGLLEAGRVNKAQYHLERWNRHAQGKQAHTTREGLDQELTIRAELYRCRPPARLKILILIQPVAVNDDVPTEAEVKMAVRGQVG